MPIYEYECPKCKKVHEVTQKMSDKPLTRCPTPKCKGKVKKIMSMTSFALKGSGWYTTDYKKSGTKKASSSKESKKTEACSPAGCAKPQCSKANA